MTVREFITGKFSAFGLTNAQLEELNFSIPLDNEYTPYIAKEVGRASCDLIAEMLFFPRQKSVSEAGFSVSWDFDSLGKYYLYLCKRYGVPVNKDVLSMMGVSTIIDKTSIW